MAIVNSTWTKETIPAIGDRYVVTEIHTDSVGGKHRVIYLAPSGYSDASINAQMTNRAVVISTQLAETEAKGILNG